MPEGDKANKRRREILRQRFRPASLRVLFVGESPPASGRFFYAADSGLYRAMREAFRSIEPSINKEDFLTTFQASGCYLVDLCPEPVDHMDFQSRRAACHAREMSLSREIARLHPPVIATVVRSIEGNVERAISRAHWRGTVLHLPYPGRWAHSREVFIGMLTSLLVPTWSQQVDSECSIRITVG